MAIDTCTLKKSDINHLRRLLAYLECEVGQSPEEMQETIRNIGNRAGPEAFTPEGIASLQQSYERSKSIPKYVRDGIKALKKTIKRHEGEIVDVEPGREVLAIEDKQVGT